MPEYRVAVFKDVGKNTDPDYDGMCEPCPVNGITFRQDAYDDDDFDVVFPVYYLPFPLYSEQTSLDELSTVTRVAGHFRFKIVRDFLWREGTPRFDYALILTD